MEEINNFQHNCVIIRVRKESIAIRGNLYKAVCRCWAANKKRAEKADFVLAVVGTIKEKNLVVQAVYKPDRWYYPADVYLCKDKKEECQILYEVNTDLCNEYPRIAFEGKEVSKDAYYLHKMLPSKYYPLQNPVRYTYI